jgi:hypothetical protein
VFFALPGSCGLGPEKPSNRGGDVKNKSGPKPSHGKIGSDNTLRFSRNAELARQAVEREKRKTRSPNGDARQSLDEPRQGS